MAAVESPVSLRLCSCTLGVGLSVGFGLETDVWGNLEREFSKSESELAAVTSLGLHFEGDELFSRSESELGAESSPTLNLALEGVLLAVFLDFNVRSDFP